MPFGNLRDFRANKKTGRITRRRNLTTVVNKAIQRHQETKFHSISQTPANVDVNPTSDTHTFTNIAQGDSQNQRIGNQLYVTGYHFEVTLLPEAAPSGASAPLSAVRIVVYIPKDSDDSITAFGPETNLDLDNYTFLYDKTFPMTPSQGRRIVLSKKFNRGARKGIKVQYNGTLGTDVAKNPIKMSIVQDNSLDFPTYQMHGRIYYKDA